MIGQKKIYSVLTTISNNYAFFEAKHIFFTYLGGCEAHFCGIKSFIKIQGLKNNGNEYLSKNKTIYAGIIKT